MSDLTSKKTLLAAAESELHQMASFIDLTSLNDNDTDDVIKSLCERAIKYNVAAVCVYPPFVKTAKEALKESRILVATVANFPHGGDDFDAVKRTIEGALKDGADEIDVVLPYARFKNGDKDFVENFLAQVKETCGSKTLKVILETGELVDSDLIAQAASLAIACGAAFVKTSTGKSPISATILAAESMLKAITESNKPVGLKVSGGIRTVDEAKPYLALAEKYIHPLSTANFRIGASSLLGDIEKRLAQTSSSTTTTITPTITQKSDSTY